MQVLRQAALSISYRAETEILLRSMPEPLVERTSAACKPLCLLSFVLLSLRERVCGLWASGAEILLSCLLYCGAVPENFCAVDGGHNRRILYQILSLLSLFRGAEPLIDTAFQSKMSSTSMKGVVCMTDKEKKRMCFLRSEGFGYGTIAKKLGISENTVKSFCMRNGLTGVASKPVITACRYCGKELTQEEGRPIRARKFCSEECRRAWWKAHPELLCNKVSDIRICNYCGKKFKVYAGNRGRKYCCHHCYIMARFGDKPRKWEVLERGKKD